MKKGLDKKPALCKFRGRRFVQRTYLETDVRYNRPKRMEERNARGHRAALGEALKPLSA